MAPLSPWLRQCYKADHKEVLCFQRAPKETVMCRYFAFKGAPNSNCNLKVICFQRGAHQLLKYVSTLLLNFTEGAPKRNWNV